MGREKSALAAKAWDMVRLALFWVRKGGIFKSNFMADLIPDHLKSLEAAAQDSVPRYADRQFSFGETPVFRFGRRGRGDSSLRHNSLLRLPCINPPADLDEEESIDYFRYDGEERELVDEVPHSGEEGIDGRAEAFIARFYQQMKLQGQQV